MKRVFQLLLLVAIVGLGYWIYSMIAVNVNAENQINEREKIVIEKAQVIRDLVQAYKDSRPDKKYTTNWDVITEYAKNGYIVEKSEIYDENNLDNKAKLDSIRKADPKWKNERIDSVSVRDRILKHAGIDTDEEIENLRYIPFSDNKEFQLDTVTYTMGTYKSHLLRCHAPYVKFIDTDTYNQEFWNELNDRFNYFINHAEANEDMKKMKAEGLKATVTREPKFMIGETHPIPMDIEFFGVTFGSLEEPTNEAGNWGGSSK